MRTFIRRDQARQLLHNKFVVVLGGSVQRSMYKDLVLLLQRDQYLTLPQLKSKGEFSFEQDSLVEGGRFGAMTNGTDYREVRQYRSSHHLVRFYFLTRIYSPYMESILEDFREGLQPDFIIVSSCVWDVTRYGPGCLEQYKENLHKFFGQLKTIVCPDCLILWSLAMPLAKKIKGGFLVPEVSYLSPTLCYNIIEANFYSSRLADSYGIDIVDLHYHFRLSLQHRMPDGVHWDALAHRRISSLLLQHAADAWGVNMYDTPSPPGHDRAVTIRPLLVPTQLANQPAGHHYGAVDLPVDDPVQIPHYRQLHSSAVGVRQFRSWLPVQLLPPPPPPLPPLPPPRAAAGHWTLCRQYNPLPPANLWPRPGVHPEVRHQRAGGGLSFHPRFQADDHCARRRRRRRRRRRGRSNFRTHPYSSQLPWVTHRHGASGW